MQTYSSHRPTGFDPAGAFLDDRQDWLVLPMSRNRDSLCLDESNFACTIRDLSGEGEDVEVHRFGHWACGWYEIIIVRPGTEAAAKAEEIADAFEDYSVVDEMDWSTREFEAALTAWDGMSMRDRIEECERAGYSIFAARHDTPPERVMDRIRDTV